MQVKTSNVSVVGETKHVAYVSTDDTSRQSAVTGLGLLLHGPVTRFYGVMVSTQDSESCDPSSNLGRT